jgi:hypothetical protein
MVESLLIPSSVAKEVVAERFGTDKVDRRDMMGSFIRHGLTQKEAETESTLQLWVWPSAAATPTLT